MTVKNIKEEGKMYYRSGKNIKGQMGTGTEII